MLLAALFIQRLLTLDWQVNDMANSVNPPPQLKVPPELLKDKATRDYIRQVETILFQLWQRMGGDTDIIDDSQQNITSTSSRVSRNAARINSLELKQFELVETDSSLTTGPFQIIDCINTNLINITLDPQAIGEDEVHIARSDATVDLIGTVNGKVNPRLNRKNLSLHLIKKITGNGWLQI